MKRTKTKNRCLVTCLTLIAMLMTSIGVKAQNVTIGPYNGSIITGIAGGNTADSGMGRGMGSMWRHEQLSLMMTTSDVARLTSSGELADPSNAIDTFDIDRVIDANGRVIRNGSEPTRLILGAGQTQTFVVVSLPKGYRITSYRLVLQPNIYCTGGTNDSIYLHRNNPKGTNKGWWIGTDDQMCFYETPAWSSDSPYGQNTHSSQLTCPDALATATCPDDGSTVMLNNNADNRAKEYVIERTSNDMTNQLHFFFASRQNNNGSTPYQYAVSIKSFEIHFTAQGTFEADVTPVQSSQAKSMVQSPFTTSKIDIGALNTQTAHDNNNNEFQVYGYNYSNVRDLIAYNYLYQKDAVSNYKPADVATPKHIYPLEVDGKGVYAFGNDVYYVEPPVTINSASGWGNSPIGFRVVGAKFDCSWGKQSKDSTIYIPNTCTVSVSHTQGQNQNDHPSGTYYLDDNLDFSSTTPYYWKMDEYGNLYIGDDNYKHYLSCFGSGETRMLSLSSSATGNGAQFNVKVTDNNRLAYHSDGNNDYYLYYERIQEGNDYHLRGHVSRNSNNYNNNNLATAGKSTENTEMTIPGFTPGNYKLVIYDKEGEKLDSISVNKNNANTDATKYTLTGLNNDALKFEIKDLEKTKEGADSCQAIVNITLMLEALNPYIDKMDIVCHDDQGNLELTQTFTASDFSVSGGKFIFYVPDDYSKVPLTFTFSKLYSIYGDNTYYTGLTEQTNGNARYSYVTSNYFRDFDWSNDGGLYDNNYTPNSDYTEKVYTSTAGNVRFKFNNAEDLGQGSGNNSGQGSGNNSGQNTGDYLIEDAFSVAKYLSEYYDPDVKPGETAEKADTIHCVLVADPAHQPSGSDYKKSDIYYVFTADETRYNIAPTDSLQHRFYAFYRMDIELEARTFTPAFTYTKLYDKTYHLYKEPETQVVDGKKSVVRDAQGNIVYRDVEDREDSMWGLTLDVQKSTGGDYDQGYLTYQEIIDHIVGRGSDPNAEDYIAPTLDPNDAIAPKYMRQILYVDGTPLTNMLNSSKDAVVKTLQDLKDSLAINALVILPENTKSLLDNVAYETTGQSTTRSFRAGHNINLMDKEPFFSPYKIQVDAGNKATYAREISGPTTSLAQYATVVLPFTLDVSNGLHTNLDNYGNATEDGFAFNIRTLNKLVENPSNNNYYDGDGYFNKYKESEEEAVTKANQPYMVQVLEKKSPTYSFIATQYGALIEPTPTVADEIAKHKGSTTNEDRKKYDLNNDKKIDDADIAIAIANATGANGTGVGLKYIMSELEQNVSSQKLTNYGTYSGARVPKGYNIYYFNNNKYVCSSTLDPNRYTHVKVRPFRAYYSPTDPAEFEDTNTSGSPAKMIGFNILYDLFSDDGGITTSLIENSKPKVMTITTDRGSMQISAYEDIQVKILSTNGINVDAFQMNAGEQRQVNVPSGIYIVNNTKILVK